MTFNRSEFLIANITVLILTSLFSGSSPTATAEFRDGFYTAELLTQTMRVDFDCLAPPLPPLSSLHLTKGTPEPHICLALEWSHKGGREEPRGEEQRTHHSSPPQDTLLSRAQKKKNPKENSTAKDGGCYEKVGHIAF